MRRSALATFALAACALPLACAASEDDTQQPTAPLALVRTIALPGVKGRIDHLALDPARKLLHVAALGNGSVETVDLARGTHARGVRDLEEPQGIDFVPGKDGAAADRVVVACGGDGRVLFLDPADGRVRAETDVGSDADNVHVDAARGVVWVAYGSGGLAAVAPEGAAVGTRVAFDVHPEGFAVDAAAGRAYVNLAARGDVAVVELAEGRVVAHWKTGARANYPLALDAAAKRLYVGCRSPARLVVLASDDGREIGHVDCGSDPDDVFVDASRRRVYVACGAGTIDVFDLHDSGAPTLNARVETARGARTMLLDAATGALHLAVPKRGSADAEIRTYEPR